MIPISDAVQALSDLHFRDRIFRIGGLPPDILSDLVIAFTIDLSSEYSLRELSRVIDYPATCVRLFNEKDNPQAVREGMISDWLAVQRGEELALTSPDMATFMDDIHWLEHTMPRLIMALAEHEEEFEGSDNLENVARACVEKFGDEKIRGLLRASPSGTPRARHVTDTCPWAGSITSRRCLVCWRAAASSPHRPTWRPSPKSSGTNLSVMT